MALLRPTPLRTLVAASALCLGLGSLHAFSLLLAPLEAATGASRTAVSFVYSAAIVCLTLAVFLGHRLMVWLAPAPLALAVGVGAAAGLAFTAFGDHIAIVTLGYGMLFGFANGTGFVLAITLAPRGWPRRPALAVGIVTAAYAVGAMAFSQLLPMLRAGGGLRAALLGLSGTIGALACIAAALLSRASRPASQPVPAPDRETGSTNSISWLWLGYFFCATAGLMAIGHAAGIVAAAGGSDGEAAAGAVVIAGGNMLGGLAAGWLTDRFAARPVLIGMAAGSAVATALAVVATTASQTIACLSLVGFAYGAIIAVYPVAAASSRSFGRVFTAWGVAGLIGPWMAGALYDATGDYTVALLIAAAASAAAAVASSRLSSGRHRAA